MPAPKQLPSNQTTMTGMRVRVPDSSLEPHLHEGAWVTVLPFARHCKPRTAVLLEYPDGLRVLAFFVGCGPENSILALRGQINECVRGAFWTPPNTIILGAVVT